jgi:hypothetical protein
LLLRPAAFEPKLFCSRQETLRSLCVEAICGELGNRNRELHASTVGFCGTWCDVAMADTVERYLRAVAAHDWAVVDACIADGIVRVGPYGDRYEGRGEYLEFISELMPKLTGYAMRLDRVTYAGEGRAYAELSETAEVDGKPMVTPEVLVFEVGGDGRIGRVDIFIQRAAG